MPDPATLDKVSVKLSLGFLELDSEWKPDPRERQAAWELYVELTSRIAAQGIEMDEGLLREALASLHALFAITRGILRSAGPEIGAQGGSVGYIALSVLNRGLRPFLAKWHPRLLAWESQRPSGVSPYEHEQRWDQSLALRGELEALRPKMWQYANALARIAGLDRPR